MHFLLHIILSALDNIQKLDVVLILFSEIAYIANNLGFSSILIIGGRGNSMAPNLSMII